MQYHKFYLSNKLRVFICPMQHVKSVSIGVWVGVGGRYEADPINGISHFLEHMLFKGTLSKSATEITQAIEGVGGNINAFTSEEYTCYYAKVPYQHTEIALNVLSDMYHEPALKEEHIAKEKHVILEELKMHQDMPSQRVYDLLSNIMWSPHPLGRMLIGSKKTIKSLSRKDFISFRRKYYNASNTVVSVSGAVNVSKVKALLEKNFGNILKGRKHAFKKYTETQNRPKLRIKTQRTQQCHLCIGVKALKRSHPDRYALRLLNVILGENMSSRLFQEVRETRGLSYDISSSIERLSDTGALIISGGTDVPKLEEAVQCILKILNDMKEDGVTKDELARAKEYIVGQLSLSMERTTNQMIYTGENEITGDEIFKFGDIVKIIRKVKLDDIKQVAEKLFINCRLNMAVVGPLKDKGKMQNILSIGQK